MCVFYWYLLVPQKISNNFLGGNRIVQLKEIMDVKSIIYFRYIKRYEPFGKAEKSFLFFYQRQFIMLACRTCPPHSAPFIMCNPSNNRLFVDANWVNKPRILTKDRIFSQLDRVDDNDNRAHASNYYRDYNQNTKCFKSFKSSS